VNEKQIRVNEMGTLTGGVIAKSLLFFVAGKPTILAQKPKDNVKR